MQLFIAYGSLSADIQDLNLFLIFLFVDLEQQIEQQIKTK